MRDRRASKFYVTSICTPISEQRGWVGCMKSLLGGSNTYCYVLPLSLLELALLSLDKQMKGWVGRTSTYLKVATQFLTSLGPVRNMRSYLQVNNAVGWGGRDDTASCYSLRGSN